jgi:sugar-specific transcriptional regulator TrmB
MGIVRPEAYRILQELCTKGLVERSLDTPIKFVAVPPDRAISILFGTFSERYTQLGKKRSRLLKYLKASIAETRPQGERFGLVAGNILQKQILMITQAKHDYVSIVSKGGLKRICGGAFGQDFLKSMVAANKRRVKIRIIAEIDEGNSKWARRLAQFVEIRTIRDLLFCMDIIDMREMIFGPATLGWESGQRPAREDDDLWTNNSRFVHGMHAMFEKLWSSSPRYVEGVSEDLQALQ